jgi:hypothetical protein
MTKNEQLDALFNEWHACEPDKQFIRDGIIDEVEYVKQKTKLLFIAKEANDSNGGVWDFRTIWKNAPKSKFDNRVAEWAWGIQNGFSNSFDEIYGEDSNTEEEKISPQKLQIKKEALQKIAFLDIKKSGGGGRANNKELKTHIEKNIDYLHKQIEIINPDIIISGLTHKFLIEALFTPLPVNFKRTGYVRCVFKWKNCRVIDFYHPSSQNVPAASYCLLQSIYQSKAFQEL